MRKRIVILFCILCMLASSGCAYVKSGVLYTIYPIEYIIERLSDGAIQAKSIQNDVIVQAASIVDDHEELLYTNAVLFHIGELEPYISLHKDEIKESLINDVDLAILNTTYRFGRYTPIMVNGNQEFIEGDYYEGDVFKTIDTDELNLFLWLDPIAMLSMSKRINEQLCLLYPELQSQLNENMKKLEADLINLDAQYQALAKNLMDTSSHIKFVSMTASFGTWQKAYGFETYPIVLSKYGVFPTSEQLAIIKQRIVADDVKYIVYEPNMTEDMVALFDELESELGLTRVELSNISSLTTAEENDGKDYLSLMYENLSVLETMLIENGSE